MKKEKIIIKKNKKYFLLKIENIGSENKIIDYLKLVIIAENNVLCKNIVCRNEFLRNNINEIDLKNIKNISCICQEDISEKKEDLTKSKKLKPEVWKILSWLKIYFFKIKKALKKLLKNKLITTFILTNLL